MNTHSLFSHRLYAFISNCFSFQAEDGIRDYKVTGVQTCALPILPAIELDKFIILISSERRGRGREPRGKIVLRGQSPSTRPMPPDVLEFSVGGMVPPDMAEHHEHDSAAWPMPPIPHGLTMLPSEMALRPEVTPFLPVSDAPLPNADSNEVLRAKDGDIIDLDAELVRRTIAGQTFTMYSYNGQYPGPLIEVSRGSEIMVRFTNHLGDWTSIHWHGIRLENAFDGVEGVSDAFTYKLRFPDAGIYWYHPHIREDVQQALGLYGNILVRDRKSTRLNSSHLVISYAVFCLKKKT